MSGSPICEAKGPPTSKAGRDFEYLQLSVELVRMDGSSRLEFCNAFSKTAPEFLHRGSVLAFVVGLFDQIKSGSQDPGKVEQNWGIHERSKI
jgi:hypothetical protein